MTGIGFTTIGRAQLLRPGRRRSPHEGFTRLFGAGYKFRSILVGLRPGADPAALDAAGLYRQPAVTPPEVIEITQMASPPGGPGGLPGAAGGRRGRSRADHGGPPPLPRGGGAAGARPDPRQARWIVVTQAGVLAVTGLAFGLPLGVALGRGIWGLVADAVADPLPVPPVAFWALVLAAPVALLTAALLALSGRRRTLTRLRVADVLRAE